MISIPDSLRALLAVAAGAGIGAIYFAGLWWSVSNAGSFRHPVASMLLSVVLRMSVALGGFYFVARDGWERVLLCLLGFLIARTAVTWVVRCALSSQAAATAEMLHAP